MSLPGGAYFIKSSNGYIVGLGATNGGGVRPRQLQALSPSRPPVPFTLKKGGKSVADIMVGTMSTGVYAGDRVCAFPIKNMGDLGWMLERTEKANEWKIKTKDGKLYWTVTTTEVGGGFLIAALPKSKTLDQVFTFYVKPDKGSKKDGKSKEA